MKRTRLASFPSKFLNITVINSFLQKLSTWVTAQLNISTGIDFLLPTSVTILRAFMTSEDKIKENNFPPITLTRTKKVGNESKNGINVFVAYWLMIWAAFSFFKPFDSYSIHCQPVIFNQLIVNLQKIMIFSVSNDGTQWILDFGADSAIIAENDLAQKITISSKKYL